MSDAETSEEREPELADAEADASSTSREIEIETGAETSDEAEAEAKPGRLQALLFEYGAIGIIVLLSLSALTWLGFGAAFMFGFQVEGAAGTAGVAAAATAGWLLTKPIRIPLAVVLTPVVAAIWHRVRGKQAPSKAD